MEADSDVRSGPSAPGVESDSTHARPGWRAAAVAKLRSPQVGGGALVVAVAVFLYTRFDFRTWMTRDSSIYLYGGQRVLHGQPPYVSMMDPKGPVSSLLAALGVAVARLFGRDDVLTVRVEFFTLAVIGVLGIYLLTLQVTRSVVTAAFAGVAFTAFRSFAYNAVAGPEGHLPGIVFLIFMLWLTMRRKWYLAAVGGMLAFLTWQPLFIYALMAPVCAVAWSPGRRRRAALSSLAGLATPVAALLVYYGWDGHLRQLVDGLLVYPLTGVIRRHLSLLRRVRFFVNDITHIYGYMAIVFWVGLALVFAAAIRALFSARSAGRHALLDPFVLLFASTLVVQLGYICYDYIGFPHTYPMLPYACLGVGWGVARALARLGPARVRWIGGAVAVLAILVVVSAAVSYSHSARKRGTLTAEQASACAVQRALVPGTPLWVIDNPGPLVLLHRRQPDNFPYVGGGLDTWKVHHTTGGFAGWTHQIAASHASVVVFESWQRGRYKQPLKLWLRHHGYRAGKIGAWSVFLSPGARARVAEQRITLARNTGPWPLLTTGVRYTVTHCPAPTRSH